MKSDIEIAQGAKLRPIGEIAAKAGIPEACLEPYGKYKAKIDTQALPPELDRKSKLILVTAISPTPAGEGKTTVSVGLADALSKIGKRTVVALREPSLGPVFGVKGGAAGGGYAQVVPMEDINLHFTGDFHAISAANNLLAAMLDNHIFQGNALNIDPERIVWRRCVDMNDRQLRNITGGLGGAKSGVPHPDHFDITAASEIMAVFCLADSIADLKARLARIIVAYDRDGKPVTAGQINAQGAMTALLKDAIKPNLVQTLEGTPAIIHGGPFANIAHGCNSVSATRAALRLADYTVTEAGFGSDLGAEKFLDIKCRVAGLKPDCVVLVATARALKMHGGAAKEDVGKENLEALAKGIPNLAGHIGNLKNVYGLPVVVAINHVPTDTQAELDLIRSECEKMQADCSITDVFAMGGEGGKELAQKVVAACELPNNFTQSYPLEDTLENKINTVVRRIYHGNGAVFTDEARAQMEKIESLGFGNLPVCIAKTQYSFSDDATLLGAPTGFDITVREVRISAGAGFVVAVTGKIMTMPGLPKVPSAERIDVDENGVIVGLS